MANSIRDKITNKAGIYLPEFEPVAVDMRWTDFFGPEEIPPTNRRKENKRGAFNWGMATNLDDAHRQWAVRPRDERFANLESLYEFTRERKHRSEEQIRSLNELRLLATSEGSIAANGNSLPMNLSNWGFRQLCTTLGAPARYLRNLPAEMARDCLQYGLDKSGLKSKLLVRDNSVDDAENLGKLAAAFTSPSYGRIWDADVLENLMRAVEGSAWGVPTAYSKNDSESSGLYASDHDVFVFMVNDEIPVEIGDARLGKGFFCWNSETGSSTFGLTTFLYNYVCGNHIVWGAEEVQELKIIHKSHAPQRFYTEALPTLNRFAENTMLNSDIHNTVVQAMGEKNGNTLEKTLDWFKSKPFTRKEVRAGWETGQAEGQDVSNVWGMVQGLTAYARDMPHCDKRVNLERRAGALLVQSAAQ